MIDKKLTRRGILKSAVVGASASFVGFALMSCTKKGDSAQAAELTCTDVSGLTSAEKTARTGLKYVEKSTIADKTCDNCQLYVAAKGPNACGTCQIMKGPIHPQGYCISWVKKA